MHIHIDHAPTPVADPPHQRSLLFYLIPSTLIGIGLAVAFVFAVPVGVAIAPTGFAMSALT